jgi:hypothetical protein
VNTLIKSFFPFLLLGIFTYGACAQHIQATDGDRGTDSEEVAAGTDPLDHSSPLLAASGTVFYVDNSGSPRCANTTSGGSETKPWCTINYAIERMKGGDTLYVKAGTYTERVYINRPAGTASQHTTIQAYPGHKVVIKSTGFSGSGRVKIENTSYITFNGFEITNFNQGLFVENSHDILVQHCYVHDVGQEAIHVKRGSSNITIQNCIIHDTRRYKFNGEGIYIGTSSSDQTSSGVNDNTNNILLKNNTIFNTNDECIELKEGTYGVTIDGNVLSNCLLDPGITSRSWGAIDILEHENHYNANPNHVVKNNIINTTKTAIGLHTGGSVFNNIIYGQTGAYRGISIDNADADTYTRRILHNTIDLPSTRAVVSSGSTVDIRNNIGPSSAGNLAVNAAYFVNASTKDYHVVSGSAPVDTGADLTSLLPFVSGINRDRDHVPRPQGSRWDMGAYEFGGTPTP